MARFDFLATILDFHCKIMDVGCSAIALQDRLLVVVLSFQCVSHVASFILFCCEQWEIGNREAFLY